MSNMNQFSPFFVDKTDDTAQDNAFTTYVAGLNMVDRARFMRDMAGHLEQTPTSQTNDTDPITPVELERNTYATAASKQLTEMPNQKQPLIATAGSNPSPVC